MQRFFYEAVDSQGHKVVASGEAVDRDTLLIGLQSRGLVLIRWLDDAPSAHRFFRRSGRTLSSREILHLTRDLAHLLKSGVPMDKALTIIDHSSKQTSIKNMAAFLKESIQGGSTLSEAMSAKSQDFKDLYVNMVRVGEMGGILPQVLEKLAQFMSRSIEIRKFIVTSSIYPAVLFFVGLLSVLVIMGFVVPRFAGIFNDLGQEVPYSTRLLIEMSAFIRKWGGWILLFLALLVGLFWRMKHTRQGKDRIDGFLIRAPFFGELISDIQVSRFARTLGTLTMSGVPLLKALSIVESVVENNVIKKAVIRIHQRVRDGKRISVVMKEGPFPPMAVQMTSLGEETGKLGEMLVLVADELDDKIQSEMKTFLAFLEPATILVMGLIIGGIVVSMLSAIFGINEIQF